jgi:stage III sporulation protein AF
MIEFLSDWMRGLILVIFLAVFLDMMLPNNVLQRYAKVVMGLLVILLMLTPVLKFAGTSVYEMNFSIDNLLPGGKDKGLPTIDQIQKQGEQLGQNNAALTMQQWKTNMAAEIKALIEKDHAVSVSAIAVDAVLNDQGQPAGISQVSVSVAPKQEPGSVKAVKPIEPVIIGGAHDELQQAPSTIGQAERQNIAAIRDEIAAEYKLTKAKVDVQWRDS